MITNVMVLGEQWSEVFTSISTYNSPLGRLSLMKLQLFFPTLLTIVLLSLPDVHRFALCKAQHFCIELVWSRGCVWSYRHTLSMSHGRAEFRSVIVTHSLDVGISALVDFFLRGWTTVQSDQSGKKSLQLQLQARLLDFSRDISELCSKK